MTDHEKSRQRACRACTLAKRRCDKILPSCLRCVDRGVDCSYLPLKRRRYQPPSQRDVHAPRSDDPALADSHGHESHDRLRRSTVISIGADNEDSTTDSAGLRNLPLDTSLHTDLSNALSSSSVPPPDTSIQGDLTWFLPLSTWAQEPCTIPTTIPSAPVFSNFVRGLQTWLTRYLVKGHSPLIHRHLYTESQIPQDMRDAVAAIALSQTRTPENEHLTDSVSSAYLCALLTRHAAHPHLTGPQLTTIEHLARTQALLAHLLLALFTPSPPRRADAEAHLGTLLLWTRQFWDSAKLDAALCALAPSARPGTASPADLYRAFVLTESARRTYIAANLAAGVYLILRSSGRPHLHTCMGDVCFTQRAGLWDAAGAARWEVMAQREGPLFLHNLEGHVLPAVGVAAAQVDEFARHVFTLLWGVDDVERWAVTTGDEVAVIF